MLTERTAKLENGISIGAMFALTALLAFLTNRDDSPYFALLAIPILQCAYLCGLLATVLTVVAADAMILFWLWHFFLLHPPARATEYLEAGMISVIYLLMGLIVWFLVNQLKLNQTRAFHQSGRASGNPRTPGSRGEVGRGGPSCQRHRARNSQPRSYDHKCSFYGLRTVS